MYLEPQSSDVVALVEYARTLDTVDTHQHLTPEEPMGNDLCRMILGDAYVTTDLLTAGMSEGERAFIGDAGQPLLARWHRLLPYWRQARFGSYARAELITLREFYGAKKLADDAEVEAVSARITEDFATPGIFRRVLLERCHISTVLTQPAYISGEEPRFYTLYRPLDRADFTPGGIFEQDALIAGVRVTSADDLVPAMDAILRRQVALGAVGFKMAALAWSQPTEAELARAFARRDEPILSPNESTHPFIRLYASRMAALAAELQLTVAIHCASPWTTWQDFRAWEPTAMIPFLHTFTDTRFDLYHSGIPYGTTASMLAKSCPNLWQSLVWSHIISPEISMRCIAEWLDMLPIGKVSAFGGDYQNWTVPFTYGHLQIACENIARVLGYRIHCGQMGQDDAREIMQAWFVENPRGLYRI